MVNILNKISDFRQGKNLTQSDLAEKMDVSLLTITRWERGKSEISSSKLIKLADFLGVSVDEILGRNPPAPKTLFVETDNTYQSVISRIESMNISDLLQIQGAIDNLLFRKNNLFSINDFNSKTNERATKKV